MICINSYNPRDIIKAYMYLVSKKLMDICLVNIDNNSNKSLKPMSIIGMLWLQTHFEADHWESIGNGQAIIPSMDSQILNLDASKAGLNVKFISSLTPLDKI